MTIPAICASDEFPAKDHPGRWLGISSASCNLPTPITWASDEFPHNDPPTPINYGGIYPSKWMGTPDGINPSRHLPIQPSIYSVGQTVSINTYILTEMKIFFQKNAKIIINMG
jgi:hypothetical protein